jgi:protein TonB
MAWCWRCIFSFPTPRALFKERALDIILVNSRSARKPADAQVLAQANLDNGGNTEQERRAKTPLPPAPRHQDGDDLEHSQSASRRSKRTSSGWRHKANSKTAGRSQTDKEEQPSPNRYPMSAAAIWHRARWRWPAWKGKSPRNSTSTTSARARSSSAPACEYRFAQYFEAWRTKVERVGTLNYPEAARGKLYGSLVLTVSIRNDGSVAGIEINRSSGHKILDDAARRIVAMAAPYGAFPPAIRTTPTSWRFTRTWNFTQSDSLETRAMKR